MNKKYAFFAIFFLLLTCLNIKAPGAYSPATLPRGSGLCWVYQSVNWMGWLTTAWKTPSSGKPATATIVVTNDGTNIRITLPNGSSLAGSVASLSGYSFDLSPQYLQTPALTAETKSYTGWNSIPVGSYNCILQSEMGAYWACQSGTGQTSTLPSVCNYNLVVTATDITITPIPGSLTQAGFVNRFVPMGTTSIANLVSLTSTNFFRVILAQTVPPYYSAAAVPSGNYWMQYLDPNTYIPAVPAQYLNPSTGTRVPTRAASPDVTVSKLNAGTASEVMQFYKGAGGPVAGIPSGGIGPSQYRTSVPYVFVPFTPPPVPTGYVVPSLTMPNGLYYLVSAPSNTLTSPLQFYTMPGALTATGTIANPPAGALWSVTASSAGITLTSVYSQVYLPNVALTAYPLADSLFYPVAAVPSGFYTPLTVTTGNYYLQSAPGNTPTSSYYATSSNSFVSGSTGSNLYVTKTATELTIVDCATGVTIGSYTAATYYKAPLVNALFVPAPAMSVYSPIPTGYVAPSTTMSSGLYYLVRAPNNTLTSPLQFYTMPGQVLATGTLTSPPAGALWQVSSSGTGITLNSMYSGERLSNLATTAAPLAGSLFYPATAGVSYLMLGSGTTRCWIQKPSNNFWFSAVANTPTSSIFSTPATASEKTATSNFLVTKNGSQITFFSLVTSTTVGGVPLPYPYPSTPEYSLLASMSIFPDPLYSLIPISAADTLNSALASAKTVLDPVVASINDALAKRQAAQTTLSSIATSIPGFTGTLPW